MTDHLRDIKQGTGTPFARGPMSKTFSSLYWFEQLVREIDAKSILEIGTGSGRLTLFFGLLCPGNVSTCDIFDLDMEQLAKVPGSVADLYRRLGIVYYNKDGQDPEIAKRLVSELKRPLFILCDDGNKPLEFEIYTPLMEKGDAIAVHDNPSEFRADEEPAQKIADDNNLMRWRKEDLEADATRLAAWIKVA